MPIDVPLHQMSLPAKMELLEALWDDLSRAPEQLESPEWHKDVLDERRRRIQSGEETLSDWDAAKEDIRRRIFMRLRILESAKEDLIEGYSMRCAGSKLCDVSRALAS